MRLSTCGIGIVLAALAAGCSGSASGPTGAPSFVAPSASGGGISTPALVTNVTTVTVPCTNQDAPGGGRPDWSGMAFDRTQLGHVDVFNQSKCTNDMSFIVWKVLPNGQQVNVAQFSHTFKPQERYPMTVALGECGATYQRDVIFGRSGKNAAGQPINPYTQSDIANDLFYAPGVFWTTPACVIVPPVFVPPPPVDQCTNLPGLQATVPPGYRQFIFPDRTLICFLIEETS